MTAPGHVEEYLRVAERGDAHAAMSLMRRLERSGVEAETLIELVRTAQIEVGRRWFNAEWTVAQEHAATAVSDAVLNHLVEQPPTGGSSGRVAVVSAEGEWHVLPVRLLVRRLEDVGWEVWFPGGSVPAEHLYESLSARELDAVVVSCIMTLHLRGAQRIVAAVHAAQLPVVVGGPAFDDAGIRAAAIGADAFAQDHSSLVETLALWRTSPPTTLARPHKSPAASALSAARNALVEDAFASLGSLYPPTLRYDERQRRLTQEDLGYHVDYLAISLDTGDGTIYSDMVVWLEQLLDARGVPPEALDATLEGLRQVLVLHGHGDAVAVLERAARSLERGDATGPR